MDTNRLQEWAGKQACEATAKKLSEVVPHQMHQCQQPGSSAKLLSRCDTNQLKLAGFDDDSDWSDDQSSKDSAAISAAGAKEQDLRRTSVASKATEMEVVSPLVRSIFETRKKLILDASQKALKKEQAGQSQTKQGHQKDIEHVVEEYEKTLSKKVQALDEEIAIFKKESKRLKNLAKEHEDGLTRLAREKAEWEQQKKSQMQAFQSQQEEQIEKLKKERQLLDHRAATLNGLPAVQRKDVEELKETLARQQEEHRGKELRLRLTINRLRAMNEDLTKQVLEMQDEIRRYESCLLSALDGRESGLQATPFSMRPCGEANHKHSCIPARQQPLEALGGRRSGRSSRQCSTEENCETLGGGRRSCSKSSRQYSTEENYDALAILSVGGGSEHCSNESTPKHLSEQAKLLSNLFSRPWKAADCALKEDTVISRHQVGPKLADWR